MGRQKRKNAEDGEIDRHDERKKAKQGSKPTTDAPVLFVEDTDSRINLVGHRGQTGEVGFAGQDSNDADSPRAHNINGTSVSEETADQALATSASGIVQHRSAPPAFCLQPSRHQHPASTGLGLRTSPATSVAVHLSSRDCTDSEGGTEIDDKECSDAIPEKGDADEEQSGDNTQETEATDAIIDADNNGASERQSQWIEERQASHEDHFDPPSFVSRASQFTNLFDGVDRVMRQPRPPTCPPPPPPPPASSTGPEAHDTPDTPNESHEIAKK